MSTEEHERIRVLAKQLRNNEISPGSNEAKELVRLESKPLSAPKNLFPVCPRCSDRHFGKCPVKIVTASQAIQKFLPEIVKDSSTIPPSSQRPLFISSPSPSPTPITSLDKTQAAMYTTLEHHRKQLAALDINPTPVIVNPVCITDPDSTDPPVTTSSTQPTSSQMTQPTTTQANEPMDTQPSSTFQRFVFPTNQPPPPAVIPFSQPRSTFAIPPQLPQYQPVPDTHPFALSFPASSNISYQPPLQVPLLDVTLSPHSMNSQMKTIPLTSKELVPMKKKFCPHMILISSNTTTPGIAVLLFKTKWLKVKP